MEYVIGPVLALLLSMKFTAYKSKMNAEAIVQLEEKTKVVESQQDEMEKEIPKKMMATLLPVAKAVQKLNTQVGIK